MIQSFSKNYQIKSLAESIQTKGKIFLATDGSETSTKSGRVSVIIDSNGVTLVEKINPDSGTISKIYSHRSEIFGLISALIFLDKYCKYYFPVLESGISYFCDNMGIITKVKAIKNNRLRYDTLFKTTNHDVVLLIKDYMPEKITISHVKGRA